MRNLEEILEERLMQQAFLADALENDLLNYSALARAWQPWLSTVAYKDVSIGAISMALRRLVERKNIKSLQRPLKFPVRKIVLQPHLFEAVYVRSPNTEKIHRRLTSTQERLDDDNLFLHVSQGMKEATFIASTALYEPLQKLSASEKKLNEIRNLSAITVFIAEGSETTPGIFYPFIRALAWENISIIEILSIWSELVFIVQEKDTEQALAVLQNLTE